MRKVPKAEKERKVAAALAKVNLTGLERRFPSELSGGQQQRVALARALVFEPDLILLDEPLGALDKNLREQMQMELKRIHRGLGVTMIYVTHDQTEAMAMSDRIAVFNGGRIEQVGPPDDIYFRPQTSFVASFVGDSNILEGTALADGRFRVEGLGPVAASRDGRVPGEVSRLLLRPEMVRLAAAPADARAAIEIETRVNHGDHVLIVGMVGGRPLRARIPALDAQHLPERGICYVTWQPRSVHVIPQ
jgi:putative spermidine/putrescine transport system ATP-binding protein